ncbi:MAG: amino acid adenylation domain-containing protein [Crocinitomix sp.]|nr:amino acid adenylation domain-containing protein [Crocinitomix sp.]
MKAIEIITKLKAFKVVPKLENDQLKLVGDVKTLPQSVIDEVKLNKADLIAFLSESSESAAGIELISKCENAAYYPLSNAQQRIWILSQFDGGNEAYNIPEIFHFKGNVNTDNFQEAIRKSIERHESLRTAFKIVTDKGVQFIHETVEFKLEIASLDTPLGLQKAVNKEKVKFTNYSFDLEKAPLFRAKIYQINQEESVLMVNMHHIISDGWSSGILIQEILSNYTKICKGNTDFLAPLDIQYKDYSNWLFEKLNGDFGKGAKEFWKQKKLDKVESINLPIDFPRPSVNNFDGSAQKFYFEKEQYNEVEAFSRDQKTTLFNFFRAALSITLHKWTSQNKLIIGTPVAGRSHPQLEAQIGLYVNTLPLVSHFGSNTTFEDYLSALSSDSLTLFNYQDYPLDLILAGEEIIRDTSRNPLFDVMMVVQNNAISDGSMDITQQHGFEMKYFGDMMDKSSKAYKENVTSKFDLSFSFSQEKSLGHFVEIEYKTKLFKKSTIQGLHSLFSFVVDQILQDSNILLKDIEILNKKEKDLLLNTFNQPIETHEELSIIALLKPKLTDLCDKIGLIVGANSFSYDTINKRSNAIAHVLAQSKSKKVGLLISRTENVLFTILGALKANKTYVPIDVNYPNLRIEYILNNAEISTLIVDKQGEGVMPNSFNGNSIRIEEIEENNTFEIADKDTREDTAYLIYTSGSTGKPKGVEISNKNGIAFLKWANQEFANTNYDLLYAGTSYCFDLSVFEILLPLLQGKAIRLLDNATEIADYISTDQNILINTVPSVVRNLLDINMSWKNVTALNMAGEPIPRIFKEQLDYEKIEIRNLYGPSEDTTYSTYYRFLADELSYIPIGKPIKDTHLYILNDNLQLLPLGVEGEIYLSGESVAKGYYMQPKLTTKKFIDNPFLAGAKMYKTGDIGKWSSSGQVEFIGRIDDQVKVRGYRIELGEIEYQLEQIPQIKQAVVIIKNIRDESEIIAYYQLSKQLQKSEIKAQLLEKLPEYMLPSAFIELPEIPMNANGKVDKKQLPDLVLNETAKVVLPKSKKQKQLLALWEQVLHVNSFGINANFFDLGGHSLKATQLKSLVANTFSKELTLNEIFQFPTVLEQSELLDKKGKISKSKIEPVASAQDNAYPVSFAQERLWILNNFKDVSKAYHMPVAFEIKGDLNIVTLEKAINMTVEKHESLRTVFKEIDGVPMQIILSFDERYIKITEHTLDKSTSLQEEVLNNWAKPFDLEKGPLVAVSLWKQENRTILSFNMHHIISDGWSLGVLFKDVIKAYASLAANQASELIPLKVQYKDFAIWQREEMTDEVLANQLSYWKDEVFADGVQMLELPYDRPRPALKTYNGNAIKHVFSKTITAALNKQASENGTSLFMGLLAHVNVLMKKLANSDDITIGIPVLGRESIQLQQQIGFFVNTLPIRTLLKGEQSFKDLLHAQREQLLKAFDHQHFPFDKLVEELQPKRDLSRSPLFDVMVTLQNFDQVDIDAIDLDESIHFSKLNLSGSYTKYDLTFSFVEEEGALKLEFEYNTDLFDESTIRRMVKQLSLILETTCENHEVAIKDISVLDKKDIEVLLGKADQSNVAYDKDETILSRFNKSVEENPNSIALKVADQLITYKELDERSGQLAMTLHENYGVKTEDLIVLHTSRSEWMLICILGVLKAGAAYVPVDPDYPFERFAYILTNSGAKLLLTDLELNAEKIAETKALKVVDVTQVEFSKKTFEVAIKANNLAYIIYTSGTTGKPKGVLIEHGNVNRLLFNESDLFDFNSSDKWSLFHSYCFDFSVWEMYGALLKGGTLVMVPKEIAQDSIAFYDFLKDEEITVLNQTPTAFRSLSLHNKNRFFTHPLNLRYVIFGGESLSPFTLEHWHKAFSECKLINMYGITETTVHVTYKEITSIEIQSNKCNIGLPIPTLSCYVLDNDLKPCPVGVVGELFVGGAGVARGYHMQPELTKQRFLQSPFYADQRIYKSGDFAKILPNGDLEYIGRKDDQVKIRGHRIELSEVEIAIQSHEMVEAAVIITLKNEAEEHELIAYLILLDAENEVPNFRLDLSKKLPAYMVPSQFMILDEFPLTSNGKLNKEALPHPNIKEINRTNYIAPRNEIDRKIIAIWQEVLEHEKIGIQDNFFDLGGHSLKATRVISKIQEEFNVKIDLKNLFADATVENLSNYVDTVSWVNDENEMGSDNDELIM